MNLEPKSSSNTFVADWFKWKEPLHLESSICVSNISMTPLFWLTCSESVPCHARQRLVDINFNTTLEKSNGRQGLLSLSHLSHSKVLLGVLLMSSWLLSPGLSGWKALYSCWFFLIDPLKSERLLHLKHVRVSIFKRPVSGTSRQNWQSVEEDFLNKFSKHGTTYYVIKKHSKVRKPSLSLSVTDDHYYALSRCGA